MEFLCVNCRCKRIFQRIQFSWEVQEHHKYVCNLFLSYVDLLCIRAQIHRSCHLQYKKKLGNWQQFLPSIKYSTHFSWDTTEENFSFYVLKISFHIPLILYRCRTSHVYI